MNLSQLTTSDWIGIIGIVVALIIGVIQILKNSDQKNNAININQKAGALSKSKQKISIETDKDSKND